MTGLSCRVMRLGDDRSQLQGQLSELQRQKQEELENLQNRINQAEGRHVTMSESGHGGPPGIPPATDQSGPQWTIGDDARPLADHAAALQRLEELQQTMIGGERAGDTALRQALAERQKRAEDKRALLLRANQSLVDDDGIIERIFNSLTDEVRAKTSALERSQVRLRSAQEDISDLQAEFELDRQDYLDTIRSQERMLRLHQQLLSTMVGLVRRDCNYYSIDKIKVECTWNEDEAVWILFRVTTTKTSLSPVVSHSTMQRRSASTSTLPSSSSSFGMGHRMKGTSPSSSPRAPRHPGIMEEGEGERRPSGEEMEYFRPKRALELLAEGEQRRREGGRSDPHKWSSHTTPGMATGTSNAAAVHGLETLLAGDPGLSRRPGRLQSLPVNPSLPPSLPVPQTATDVLETVDRKLTKRSKRHSLEPITDMHKRPPPM